MFTLLRNYKAMFMTCIANYQASPEGQAQIDAALQDEKLNYSEIQNLAELPAEMQKAIIEKISGELELTTDIASGLGDVNPSERKRGESLDSHKTIQFMLSLAQKLDGKNLPGGIDGMIGDKSITVFKSHVSSYDGEIITQAVIAELITVINSKITERAQEIQAEREARQSALALLAQYESVEEIKALDENGKKAAQEALRTLGYYTKAIDGDFGSGSTAAFDAAQDVVQEFELAAAESRLATAEDAVANIQGPHDATSTIAERDAAEAHLETLQQDIADQADVYSRLEMSDEPTAQELKDLLKQDPEGKMLLCQLQADMKLLKDQDGNTLYTGAIDGHKGIDYAFGPGTAAAVTKALEMYGSITAIRRAARIAEVAVESERNTGTGRTNQGIDLVAQTDGYEAGALEAFLAEYKVTANMPEEIQNGSAEEQEAWVIMQAISMGDRENENKTRLTFIDGLSASGNDRIIEVMSDLRANFETTQGKGELMQAMAAGKDLSSEDFVNGEVGAEDYEAFELGGRIIDTGLLDSAYIATGSEITKDMDGSNQRGTMEVPIWNTDGSINEKFAELDFANATYINGAIVMTMKNGCEGNLVIIPVQREKYVPPVIVPRTPTTKNPNPKTPETTDIPESDIPEDEKTPGRRCRYLEKCEGGRVWRRLYCYDTWWGKNPSYGPWEETNESCGGGTGGGGQGKSETGSTGDETPDDDSGSPDGSVGEE